MIPPKQKAPDQSAFTTTRVAPSASVSGDGLVKHALNLRAIRASKEGQFIDRNSGKSPLFSACFHALSRLAGGRFGGFRGRKITAAYSRRVARPKFAFAREHMPSLGFSSLNLAGLPSGFPVFFGKFRGNGVGARRARI